MVLNAKSNKEEGLITSDDLILYSDAPLPTQFGEFRLMVFHTPRDKFEHLAIVAGDVKEKEGVLARVHSECLTGEVFGSLRCDCKEQLELALSRIAAEGMGVVVYLRQEGRGIGLGNKIKAYNLQDAGHDTYDANNMLGFPDDLRSYDIAVAIINFLGIKSLRLMTNNPDKIRALAESGVKVVERVAHQVEPNRMNYNYLKAKRDRHGHLISNLRNIKNALTKKTVH